MRFQKSKKHFVYANSRLSVLVILRQDLATCLSLEREAPKSSLTLSMPRGCLGLFTEGWSVIVSPATVQGQTLEGVLYQAGQGGGQRTANRQIARNEDDTAEQLQAASIVDRTLEF